MTNSIRLSQTHPTIKGRRNGYRERWAEVDGRVYRVHADGLYEIWQIEDDVEHLSGAEALAAVESDDYFVSFAMTLAEARQKIAEIAAQRRDA